jgi:hypothetical protein
MKPLKLDAREIDLVVAALEQALIFWGENIEEERLPEGFDIKVAESLYDDLIKTYIKFSNLQEDIETDLGVEEEALPSNVLRFPVDK